MTTDFAVPHLGVAGLTVGVLQHDAGAKPRRLFEETHRGVHVGDGQIRADGLHARRDAAAGLDLRPPCPLGLRGARPGGPARGPPRCLAGARRLARGALAGFSRGCHAGGAMRGSFMAGQDIKVGQRRGRSARPTSAPRRGACILWPSRARGLRIGRRMFAPDTRGLRGPTPDYESVIRGSRPVFLERARWHEPNCTSSTCFVGPGLAQVRASWRRWATCRCRRASRTC